MNAAVQLLRESPVPMNTREIVAAAIEAGLWEPTGSKTPEQSLYGSIFREIAAKEHPRIVRAEQKGKFRIAERWPLTWPEEFLKKILFRLALSRVRMYLKYIHQPTRGTPS